MSNPQVELHVSNLGVITIELDMDKAPKSSANFLEYVKKGHYDNTVFHRVIPGFMVQGGGFEPGMKEKKSGAPINKWLRNPLSATLMKNCAVAECGSLVRAIATV